MRNKTKLALLLTSGMLLAACGQRASSSSSPTPGSSQPPAQSSSEPAPSTSVPPTTSEPTPGTSEPIPDTSEPVISSDTTPDSSEPVISSDPGPVEVTVKFTITVTNVPDDKALYVAGSFNSWTPAALTAEANDAYSFSLTKEVGTTITYKYIIADVETADRKDWDTLNATDRSYTFAEGETAKDEGTYELTPLGVEVTVTFTITVIGLAEGSRVVVAGDFNDWSAGELTAGENNAYSFVLTGKAQQVIKYKYVIITGTKWDWDTLNAGDRFYTFAEGETTKDDGTVDLTPVEPTKPLHTWSIVGQYNDWNVKGGSAFVYDEETDIHTLEFDALKGDMFKVVADAAWGTEIGKAWTLAAPELLATEGDVNNPNAQFLKNGKYRFTIADAIDLASEEAYKSLTVTLVEETSLTNWTVVGDVIGGEHAWDIFNGTVASFDSETKTHTLVLNMKAGNNFRILANRSWGVKTLGKEFAEMFNDPEVMTASNDGNGIAQREGKYTITIKDNLLELEDVKEGLTIELEGYEPPVTPVDQPKHHWYIVGQYNGWDTSSANAFTYDPETKVHTLEMDMLRGDMFKIVADRAWDIQTGKIWVDAANDPSLLVAEGDANNPNAQAVKNGKYTLTIKDDVDLAAENAKDSLTVNCVPAENVNNWTLVGSMNGWDITKGAKAVYNSETKVHVLSATFYKGQQFKLVANRTWAIAYGELFARALNDDTKLTAGDGEQPNCRVVANGTYTITIKDAIDFENPLESISVVYAEIPAQNIDVYFKDAAWWTGDNAASKAFVFRDGAELAGWPGVATEKIGTIDGRGVWHISIDLAIYTKVVFTRCSPTDGAYWDARTVDISLSDFSAETPMYDISASEQAWGSAQAVGEWKAFDKADLDPVVPVQNELKILAEGAGKTRIEGAGVFVFFDNSELGINGANATDVIGAATVALKGTCAAEQAFMDALEITGMNFQEWSDSDTKACLHLVLSAAPNSSWDYELEFTITFVINEQTYVGTAKFAKGNYVDPNFVPTYTVYFRDAAWWNKDAAATMAQLDNAVPVKMEHVAYVESEHYNYWKVEVPETALTITFLRYNGAGTENWGAATTTLVLADRGQNNDMYDISAAAEAWVGEGQFVEGNWCVYDYVAPAAAFTPIAEGASASRVDGAGVFVFFDNTELGITPENWTSVKENVAVTVTGVSADHQDFMDSLTIRVENFQQWSDENTKVCLYLVMNAGMAPDWDYTLTISVTISLNGKVYSGIVNFANGVFVPANS